VNGEECVQNFTNSFSLNDLMKRNCGECMNFSGDDLEKNFRALGFVPIDREILFSEYELETLFINREVLETILTTQINEVQKNLIQVKEIRKSFLQERHPNVSEEGIEDMIGFDDIFCEIEEYLQELELLEEIFNE